jgi:hypothetical protein
MKVLKIKTECFVLMVFLKERFFMCSTKTAAELAAYIPVPALSAAMYLGYAIK